MSTTTRRTFLRYVLALPALAIIPALAAMRRYTTPTLTRDDLRPFSVRARRLHRFSVLEDDPGYIELAEFRARPGNRHDDITVLFNGEPIDAATADERRGEVVVWNPNPMNNDNEPRYVTLHGHVEIRITPDIYESTTRA